MPTLDHPSAIGHSPRNCDNDTTNSRSRWRKATPLLLTLLLTTSCAHNRPTTPEAGDNILLTFGETEYIYVVEANHPYDARIDTGATTNSIHAENITPFERDGTQWVQFQLVNFRTQKRIELEKPIIRTARIKGHDTEPQERYVVELGIQLKETPLKLEFTLNDRSDFKYPLLVGRNLLRGVAVVDVSKRYQLGKLSPLEPPANPSQ